MGRLLDAYDRLQASPLGSTSALRNDSGLRQLGSQRRDLTSALRRGIREAKREGNAERVLKYQQMGDSQGLQTSGIGSAERRMQGDDLAYTQRGKESSMNADLANRAADGVNKIGAAPQVEIGTDKTGGPTATTDPNATAGAKFAATATAEPAPRLSFADQDKAAVRRSTLDSSFGTGARDKMRREEASSITDQVAGGEIDLAEGTRQAVNVGGNAYTLTDAVNRKQQSVLAAEIRSGVAAGKETDIDVSDGWSKRATELGVGDKATALIERERKKKKG
jgi:hypothetical protein